MGGTNGEQDLGGKGQGVGEHGEECPHESANLCACACACEGAPHPVFDDESLRVSTSVCYKIKPYLTINL